LFYWGKRGGSHSSRVPRKKEATKKKRKRNKTKPKNKKKKKKENTTQRKTNHYSSKYVSLTNGNENCISRRLSSGVFHTKLLIYITRIPRGATFQKLWSFTFLSLPPFSTLNNGRAPPFP